MIGPSPSAAEQEHRTHAVEVNRVPVYPVVRLELRELTGGLWSGLVNGTTVCDQVDEEGAREALLARAAQAASLRPGGGIRVVAEGFDEETSEFVVTADGHMTPTGAPKDKRSRRRVIAVASGMVAVVAAAGVTLTMVARAAPSHSGTAGAVPRTAGAVRVLRPRSCRWCRRRDMGRWRPGRPPCRSPEPMPWPPRTGWCSPRAQTPPGWWRWTPPPGSKVARDSGWRFPGNARDDGRGPVVVGSGASAVVMAWSVDHVTAWSASTGAPMGEWPLPAAAQVVAFPLGVVAVGQGQHASVFTSSGMTERVIPRER